MPQLRTGRGCTEMRRCPPGNLPSDAPDTSSRQWRGCCILPVCEKGTGAAGRSLWPWLWVQQGKL